MVAAGSLFPLPIVVDDEPVPARPRTRGECVNGVRPCPWASCRHHLALDVVPGTVKLAFPSREIWELPEMCSLDVADRSDHTLDEVAHLLNVTLERIRQIEIRALLTFRRNAMTLGIRPSDIVGTLRELSASRREDMTPPNRHHVAADDHHGETPTWMH